MLNNCVYIVIKNVEYCVLLFSFRVATGQRTKTSKTSTLSLDIRHFQYLSKHYHKS